MKETEQGLLSNFYKVSHDLKSPLNSIIGLTNVAISEIDDPKALYYFNKIKLRVEKLKFFVEDILNATQIAERATENQSISFDEMIQDILQNLQSLPNFKRVDVIISIQQQVPFFSDATILYSILQNVIENSIKYQDLDKRYSFLKIKIQVLEDMTKIELEDNGIGISEEMKDKVFEMFFRGTDRSTGNGLGLFIVKKSLEKLNGSINIQSKEGSGMKTTITFQN